MKAPWDTYSGFLVPWVFNVCLVLDYTFNFTRYWPKYIERYPTVAIVGSVLYTLFVAYMCLSVWASRKYGEKE